MNKALQARIPKEAQDFVKKYKRREDRARQELSLYRQVFLLDGSGTMTQVDAVFRGKRMARFTALSKIWDILKVSGVPAVVFSNGLHSVGLRGERESLPFPCGDTPMRAALRSLHGFAGLKSACLVSDGLPTDDIYEGVIKEAVSVGVPIDTIYVGGYDAQAISLMETIARRTGGRFHNLTAVMNFDTLLSAAQKFLLEGEDK